MSRNGKRPPKETRCQKERADRLALGNERLRDELVSIAQVSKLLLKAFGAMEQMVVKSRLEAIESDEVLNCLARTKQEALGSRSRPRMRKRALM